MLSGVLCETCGNVWVGTWHACPPPMALDARSVDSDAATSTYAELAEALVSWRAIASGRLTVPSGALLAAETNLGLLADRLEAAQDAHHAKSDALIPPPSLLEPGAPRPERPDLEGMQADLERRMRYASVHKRSDDYLQRVIAYALQLDQDAAAAREALQHINDWAALDREGERFPWILRVTAEALKALEAGSPCHCARLLPALKRWLATCPVGVAELPPGWLDEFCAARDALQELAREVTS